MSGKLITQEGKELRATLSADDMVANLNETLDKLRAGLISPSEAMACASLCHTVVKIEAIKIAAANARHSLGSKFLGVEKCLPAPRKEG